MCDVHPDQHRRLLVRPFHQVPVETVLDASEFHARFQGNIPEVLTQATLLSYFFSVYADGMDIGVDIAEMLETNVNLLVIAG